LDLEANSLSISEPMGFPLQSGSDPSVKGNAPVPLENDDLIQDDPKFLQVEGRQGRGFPILDLLG
jgi:hypothetical protein